MDHSPYAQQAPCRTKPFPFSNGQLDSSQQIAVPYSGIQAKARVKLGGLALQMGSETPT